MLAVRIVMRAVNHAALFVPLVHPVEGYRITGRKRAESGGNVDIVGEQEGLPGRKAQDEPLMATTLVVVRQDPFDDAFSRHLDAAALILERVRDDLIAGCSRRARGGARFFDPQRDGCQTPDCSHRKQQRREGKRDWDAW